jgi:hypothetical protein
MTTKPCVFLGSSSESQEYARVVQSLIFDVGGEVTAWWSDDAFPAGKTFIESLFELTTRTNASLLLASPDDKVTKRGDLQFAPRDNIMFEHGLFAGAHGRGRAAIATVGNPSLPTDLLGVVVLSLQQVEPVSSFKERNRETIRKWVTQLQQPSPDVVSAALRALPERDTLVEFMQEMDAVWQKFDDGGRRIHRQDYVTARNFNDALDEFFQHYQSVFGSILKEPEAVASVHELTRHALEEAGESLLNAWENIAEGKMRMADDMSRDLEYRSLLKPYAATYDKAAGLLQQGKRGKS